MVEIASPANQGADSLLSQVRRAVIWRSGVQIVAQALQWAATFLVIRILTPSDYGLFAMTGPVMVFLSMLNGYGLASGLVQRPDVTDREIRQLFGMLIALNATLAVIQVALAPLAAAYYHQPAVADLLRMQALLYLATPFIALPYAILSRSMEFQHQAKANLLAAVAGAGTALAGALSEWGVWTLVAAPMALFFTRAIVMTIAARTLMWPNFDFRGAGHLARFGGIMAVGQLFWFCQSQVDVFIAGRFLSAHMVGIYTTALFLTQIFVAKFVPPLNEVAFSAYARIQSDRARTASAFVHAVRIVMVAALPFYAGLAVTADPLVPVLLGEKWREAVPIVRILALAMPFMTLQILITPVCDARGRPGIGVGNGAIGSAILAIGFIVGVNWGATGLAVAWLAAYPLYLAVSLWRSLAVIGTRLTTLSGAIAPALLAASAMACVVSIVAHLLPATLPAPFALAIMVVSGAGVYGCWLLIFHRAIVRQMIGLLRR